jgi:hypothetical protein
MTMAKFSSATTQRITANVEVLGRTFAFELCNRPVKLGDHATIQYYWMDSSQLRNCSPAFRTKNYDSCLDLWWFSRQERGWHPEEEQIHFLLANVYPLICKTKRLQHVCRDAFLESEALEQTTSSLADEDRDRINSIVRSQDRSQVKQEMDSILGRCEPAREGSPAHRAFTLWARKGVYLWQTNGREGLHEFLERVRHWLEKYRRTGRTAAGLRHFINLFGYEVKIRFYTCFANAWVAIIPFLEKHHDLDPISARFLRFWHNQNRAIEIPEGQTASGIWCSKPNSLAICETGPGGQKTVRHHPIPTKRIEPTHLPDVFSGQVLSLHPLSGFFMMDPVLCDVAGQFFAAPNYDQISANGGPEYWRLIGAILTAGLYYRQASDEQANGRGFYFNHGNAVEPVAAHADDGSHALLFEDFASSQEVTCSHPNCTGQLQFVAYILSPDQLNIQIQYRCNACNSSISPTFPSEALADWLKAAS